MLKFLASIGFLPILLIAAGPKEIPKEHYEAFTMHGKVFVHQHYVDSSYSSDEPLVYTSEEIEFLVEKAKNRQPHYYGLTDLYLYDALEQFPIEGKSVAIIGSVLPWYESIVLAFGGKPTTIEYNKIISDDPRLELLTVEEFEKNPKKFDAIISISSFEHDGLGRYGDPINPHGDFDAMRKTKKMLKKGGILFLSVPVGKDCIVWNLHRVYGHWRLNALTRGWHKLGDFGFELNDLNVNIPGGTHQPVFVLKPLKDVLEDSR